ncbi:cytochrome oxidase complex assembly protein 1-domain-containing protein [Geopyxis carbonaria]|nr:cytochrome oxidase complex assembly protein 1-domain-containing protein [Geopyxis carbonaria]
MFRLQRNISPGYPRSILNRLQFHRRLVTAPHEGGIPFTERRNDRELPDLKSSRRSYIVSIPLFLLAVGGSALAIFNYQKSSSSVVASSLYALRVHDEARKILGEEIQFKHKFPWISGPLNQFGGIIDISYDVKGTKGEGTMHFKSTRKGRMGLFETETWKLKLKNGTELCLLENAVASPQA